MGAEYPQAPERSPKMMFILGSLRDESPNFQVPSDQKLLRQVISRVTIFSGHTSRAGDVFCKAHSNQP